jgi:hypothetical protein
MAAAERQERNLARVQALAVAGGREGESAE